MAAGHWVGEAEALERRYPAMSPSQGMMSPEQKRLTAMVGAMDGCGLSQAQRASFEAEVLERVRDMEGGEEVDRAEAAAGGGAASGYRPEGDQGKGARAPVVNQGHQGPGQWHQCKPGRKAAGSRAKQSSKRYGSQ